MKKFNAPLIMGGIILILILSIIIFPEVFTDKSPYNIQKMIFSTSEGTLNVERAPYPPSKDYIMGSDEFGRDIYSFIIYGTGLTILLGIFIALGRFLIAIPIALSAGFGNNTSKSIIKQFGILFSAIPALLVSVIILKLGFFTSLEKTASIFAFVVILSLIGWPKLGNLIMERVDTINKQPFIRSEVALGKSRLKIATENVFPHLAPEVLVLFFMEIARALSMIMQMGIFSVFIGLLKIIKDTQGGISFYDVSFEPEWAGLLSTSRTMISEAPWTVIFPALAFFISVLGFNLFGEGLRNAIQRRNSMFIPRLRKLLSFDIKYIWTSFNKKVKIISSSILAVLLALILLLSLTDGGEYKFKQMNYGLPVYDSVVIGTESALGMADFLSNEMERLGIKPFDDNYLASYEIRNSVLILDSSFVLTEGETKINAEFESDYYFQTAASGIFKGLIYDATKEDMFNLNDYSMFENKFVMLDKVYYSDAAINYFINQIREEADIKGILLVVRADEKILNKFAYEGIDKPVINISKQLVETIKSHNKIELSVSTSLLPLYPTGTNVVGILEGAEGSLQEEAIIIGMRYNYLNEDECKLLEFNIQLMERICKLEKNSRSIIFMFLDGTMSDSFHGIYGITENFPYSASKSKVYIDLTGLNSTEFDYINYSSAQAPFTRQYAWSLGHQLEKAFNSSNIEMKELETIYFGIEYYFTDSYASNAMFFDRGVASIIIGTEDSGRKKHNIYDIGEIVLETIRNNNY
ncbi:MAG: ABC transporter permease [Clostridiales bacterium]|nr:ABC transporter permease [Clostridiales bacterium]